MIKVTPKLIDNIIHGEIKDWIGIKAWRPDPNEWDNGVLYGLLSRHHEEEATRLIELVKALAEHIDD